MKPSRSSRLLALLLFLSAATALWAAPRLHMLDIWVVLDANGDAHITERRLMTIDSEGTECYIVVGNLNGSQLQDFSVSDETGTLYEPQSAWDINQSRSWKAGRCGIVANRNGYELCWGLGDPGERTYETRYTVTNLLRAYQEADGFNYMFVAEGLAPSPEQVRLTIASADSIPFTEDCAAIWGFRFRGEVRFQDGCIVATSSEPFERRSAMVVMARFGKGTFQPALSVDESFEALKERAMEGSDYSDDDDFWAFLIFVAFIVFSFLFIVGGYFFYVWYKRRKVLKGLDWFRGLPYDGNLQQTNDALNAYSYFGCDYNNLLSACILRLINDGAISIETTANEKGKTRQNFVIHKLPHPDDYPQLLRMVHKIFRDAAGEDTVLEPKELKTWMKSRYNQSYTDSFVQTLHTKTSIYQYRDHLDDVRRVFGLKKYLKDFTLLNERNVGEVALWKDYMIYATLFGIADQVIRDMKRINPDYFTLDQVARQMADDTTLPMIRSTMHSSTSRAAMSKAEREARASGRGGSSSWGGGGGFSGGGFGGGVR